MLLPIGSPDSQAESHLQRARRALARVRELRRSRAARKSLRTMVAILKAQQEATLDGILVVDNEGRVLSYNRRFLEIWGIPENVAHKADDNELLGYAAEAVVGWDKFIELVNHLYTHPHEVRSSDRVDLKDGRLLSRATVPVVDDGGRITGRAWYFRDISEEKRNETLQAALFHIAQLTRESRDLDEFYTEVHRVVGTLMDATNFYIAKYDPAADVISFPYFVDQFDEQPPVGASPGRGLTGYVLRTGEPLLATPDVFDELVARGECESIGAASVDWLGVPLKSGDRTWGVLGVQTYDESRRYTEKEKEILVFVSQHVASAIEQKQK